MFHISLFFNYLATYFKTRLTYRSDFWIEVISDLVNQSVNLLFIFVVFLHTPSLGDWSQAEIVFIYGYFLVPYGIFSCFFNLWSFTERYIVKGEMDRVLTRPAYNLYQLMLENLDPASLFGSITGLVIMGAAWTQLDGLPFYWYDPLVLLVLVLGSVLIYGGVYIALTSVSFFSDAPTGIMPLLYNIQNYGRYPVTIYNKILQILLTWILPFAFVGFYPAAYFLDRDSLGWFALLTPLVGIGFMAFGVSIWNYGTRKYRGAGS